MTTGIDFEQLRSSLVSHLRQQTAFSDYDFTGSNLSVLVDLLAYNSYQNALYYNMTSNEMYLQDAQIRDNVVSHAKQLNYVPRSFESAKARLTVVVTPTTSRNTLIMPKGTAFSSRIDNNSFTFTTDTAVLMTKVDNTFVSTVDVYEGQYVTETFTYVKKPLTLSNQTIDTNSITVTVLEQNGSVSIPFTRSDTLLGKTGNSKNFYVEGARDSKYQLVFGDNIVSQAPDEGSLVVVDYRISSGELPNGCRTFKPAMAVDNETNIVCTTVTPSLGGSVSESVDSIRFNAPRHYKTQLSAVQSSDYANLVRENFPDIVDVTAIGGETLTPPQYGTVVVPVVYGAADYVPDSVRLAIETFLKSRSSINMTVEVVDPITRHVEVSGTIKVSSPSSSLLVLIEDAIAQQAVSVAHFGTPVYRSVLEGLVSSVSPQVVSVSLLLNGVSGDVVPDPREIVRLSVGAITLLT